jgi:hypothetical protein
VIIQPANQVPHRAFLVPDPVQDRYLEVVPASIGAVAHLAPGLRDLSVYIDNLGDDAPLVIAN